MNYLAVAAIAVLFVSTALLKADPLEGGVDPARIKEIAATLTDAPFAFGPKIADRKAWDELAKKPIYANVIPNAEKKVKEPMPAMTFDIYNLYKKTGQRTKEYGDVRGNRHARIMIYTFAECVENKGRFIKPLEDAIAEICTEPTWIFNFHDSPDQLNWNGKKTFIDLGSILPAHDMAQAIYQLGDKLSPATRKLIVDNCTKRIFEPYHQAIENPTKDTAIWWINGTNNWNAVCHFGVVGTALGVIDDKTERAYYVAAAEKYSNDYLGGIGPDGYCAEGMGYWNYGFTNYMELAELCLQGSNGKVNLFDLPFARAAAMYPVRIAIQNGLAPSYADCGLDPKPDVRIAAFVNGHYQLGIKSWEMPDTAMAGQSLAMSMMYSCPNSATKARIAANSPAFELRSYFDHGGVLTCRPAQGSACRLGVSLKGGNNAEPHNHNDLGTFVVAVDKELPILDPGSEVYNARTFGKDRYQSKLLNSFGHPVPIIAGKLQKVGKEAIAKITKTDFTDTADTFVMDITSAFDVPELKNLTRTFVYDRSGAGSLTVTDDFAFTKPQTYAGAMITFGQWKAKGDNAITITTGETTTEVTIDTGGAAFELSGETINENGHGKEKPTHIAITLKEPLASGKVVLTVKPVGK